jgi:hypothetical protein
MCDVDTNNLRTCRVEEHSLLGWFHGGICYNVALTRATRYKVPEDVSNLWP